MIQHRLWWFLICSGLVSRPPFVRRTALPAVRPRRASDQVVPGLRAIWNAGLDVGDVVHPLHARRTGVHGVQQPEWVHRRQRELPLCQSPRAGTSQQRKRTGEPVPVDDCLEGRVRQLSKGHSPVELGRIADGRPIILTGSGLALETGPG